MFFSPRIRLKPLAQLCHRLATATDAGIDDRKIWRDEAERGDSSLRSHASVIRDVVARGGTVGEAIDETGNFFPPLFRQLVDIGETSGQQGRTYRRLATHYDHALAARRAFFARLGWPLMQLAIALFVIGLLIWIMGILPNSGPQGTGVDLLGFGLVGTRGLIIYINVLILVTIAILLLIEAVRRGAGWTSSLQRLVVQIPMIGGALKTLALARFTWALHLVLDTPLDLRRALPLALHASGNSHYSQFASSVAGRVQRGEDIHSALAATGVFPAELLDSIAVGEQSGRLVETMERESKVYQERAQTAISILAQFAGYVIWLLVSVFIIVMIFRLFSAYTQTIYDQIPK